MSTSTDSMYNAESRYLHQMFKIYFSATPLEVTKSDYLISSSILEETYKSSDSPFGEITSNELTLSLFNDNGLFNPANTSGQYYGLIKKGVMIEAFIRPDEVTEWDPQGVFYVTDWYTDSSGMSAQVTADDVLYKVLNGSVPTLPVYRNIAFNTFITDFFALFDLSVTVDSALANITIPYVYTSEHSSNKEFLTDLLESAMADCFCAHNGDVTILGKDSQRALRATLTDSDQIISVSIKQSITTNYTGAGVTYNKCQESIEQSIVDMSEMSTVAGLNSTGKVITSAHPVLSIRSVKVSGANNVSIASFSASAKEFIGSIQSTSTTNVDMSVIGTVLNSTEVVMGDSDDETLNISSPFIQTEERANAVLQYASDYIQAAMPTIEVTVRGNPKIELGSLLEINSTYYKIDFTGVLIKATYNFVGNLSCVLTLIDASSLEEG